MEQEKNLKGEVSTADDDVQPVMAIGQPVRSSERDAAELRRGPECSSEQMLSSICPPCPPHPHHLLSTDCTTKWRVACFSVPGFMSTQCAQNCEETLC